MGQSTPEHGRRLRDHIAMGGLKVSCPRDVVDGMLESSGKREL